MMEGWCRDQNFRGLVLEFYFWQTTAEIYTLMTCHYPKAYKTSCENIVSPSQTSCLPFPPAPPSLFFYADDREPKLWLGVTQAAAQLRATFSWTCKDYYDLTTIDPTNKMFLYTYIFGFKCCVERTWLWIIFLAFSASISELAWTSTWQTLTDFPKVLITRTKKTTLLL